MANSINVRADDKKERGIKLTDKQLLVYFALLAKTHRRPDGTEPHRYLYLKDISKKTIGQDICVSQPTFRAAEKKLKEMGFIYEDEVAHIYYFPDHQKYTWIPVEALALLLKMGGRSGYGGEILRLYAAIHYYKDKPQEFSAQTWVYALGLSENNQTSFINVKFWLFALREYGLIDYEIEKVRARGGKYYTTYRNVVVCDPSKYIDYDESASPLDTKAKEYKNIIDSEFEA